MLRMYDPETGSPAEVPRAHPRLLSLRAAGGLRPLLVADLVRRLAEHRKLRVWLDADAADGRAQDDLNLHPANGRGPTGRPDLDIVAVPAAPDPQASRTLRVAALRVDPALVGELRAAGIDPLAVRLSVLARPYRLQATLERATVSSADEAIRAWRAGVAEWAESPSAPMPAAAVEAVVGALEDDLDVAAALAALDRVAAEPALPPGAKFEAFAYLDRLLGLDLARDVGRLRR